MNAGRHTASQARTAASPAARDFDLGLIGLRVEGEGAVLDRICRAGVEASAPLAGRPGCRVRVDPPGGPETKARTERAKRMRQGYYFLHHHGGPVAFDRLTPDLFTLRGSVEDLNQTLFPLVTKLLLLEHAAMLGHLLLKGAVIELEGRPVLIVGPKGSGKTTLIKALRDRGRELAFVTNSVAWMDGARLHGVPAKLNVRADQVATLNTTWESAGTSCGSVLVRPEALFQRTLPSVSLDELRVVFLSGRRGDSLECERLLPRGMATLLSTFAAASNVYGMARDLWDADTQASSFLHVAHRQSALIDALSASGPAYAVSVDSFDPVQLDALSERLRRS